MHDLAKMAMQSLSDESTPFQCQAWRSNGFSESTILQLILPLGRYAIRSWPNRLDSLEKVSFWNELNQRFEHSNKYWNDWGAGRSSPFPRLYDWTKEIGAVSTTMLFEDRLWTLSEWVDGSSIAEQIVDRELVSHLARILGRIHAMSSRDRNGKATVSTLRSSSLLDRLSAIKSVSYDLFRMIDQTDFLVKHEFAFKAKHCVATLIERQGHWERFLSICSSQERNCHWIVRDLWRENILLNDDKRFTAIVDLGAARIDWPGLDFIRLFGSMAYERATSLSSLVVQVDDLWHDAFQAYAEEHPRHSIQSLDECRMLHHVSSGLALVQWIMWIAGGTMDLSKPDKSERVANRLHEICDRFLVDAI